MIISFGSKAAKQIREGIQAKKIPIDVQNVGRRKLRMLNNPERISGLRVPLSNHLKKLTGKLKNFHSLRINKEWRNIFILTGIAKGIKLLISFLASRTSLLL